MRQGYSCRVWKPGPSPAGTASLRALVCDGQQLFATGLALRLCELGHAVVLVARAAQAADALRAAPVDVCVLDDGSWRGNERSQWDGWADAVGRRPRPPVVVLTSSAVPPAARALLEVGARAVLSKSLPLTTLVAVIEQVAAGMVLPEPLLRPAAEPACYGALTGREQQALALLAQGCTTRALADRMQISYHTARQYVQRVLNVLGAHTQVEAVARALQVGLVDSPARAVEP